MRLLLRREIGAQALLLIPFPTHLLFLLLFVFLLSLGIFVGGPVLVGLWGGVSAIVGIVVCSPIREGRAHTHAANRSRLIRA